MPVTELLLYFISLYFIINDRARTVPDLLLFFECYWPLCLMCFLFTFMFFISLTTCIDMRTELSQFFFNIWYFSPTWEWLLKPVPASTWLRRIVMLFLRTIGASPGIARVHVERQTAVRLWFPSVPPLVTRGSLSI